MYAKPTIAMVNDWCFDGGFSPPVTCDPTIATDEATFGLSEINWGIPPGNLVNKTVAGTVGHRQTLYYIVAGEIFIGQQAAAVGFVNESMLRTHLRTHTVALTEKLLEENPVVLHAARRSFRRSRKLTWGQNEDYPYAKLDWAAPRDPEDGREQNLKQFLDDKPIKPGLQAYKRA